MKARTCPPQFRVNDRGCLDRRTRDGCALAGTRIYHLAFDGKMWVNGWSSTGGLNWTHESVRPLNLFLNGEFWNIGMTVQNSTRIYMGDGVHKRAVTAILRHRIFNGCFQEQAVSARGPDVELWRRISTNDPIYKRGVGGRHHVD